MTTLGVDGSQPVSAWMAELAADLLSKDQIGADGRTAYERWAV